MLNFTLRLIRGNTYIEAATEPIHINEIEVNPNNTMRTEI